MKLTERKLREMIKGILKEYDPGKLGNFYGGDEKEIEQAWNNIRAGLNSLMDLQVIGLPEIQEVERDIRKTLGEVVPNSFFE